MMIIPKWSSGTRILNNGRKLLYLIIAIVTDNFINKLLLIVMITITNLHYKIS